MNGTASAVNVVLMTDGLFFTLGKIILPFFDVFALLFKAGKLAAIIFDCKIVLAVVVVVVVAGAAT